MSGNSNGKKKDQTSCPPSTKTAEILGGKGMGMGNSGQHPPTPSVHGEGLVCKESSAKEPIELTPTLQSPI